MTIPGEDADLIDQRLAKFTTCFKNDNNLVW